MSDARVFFIWVSAQEPTVDHAVTDEEMAARNAEGRGDYRALCGAAFLPAPDDQPPYAECPACLTFLRQRYAALHHGRTCHRGRGYGNKHAVTRRKCVR
jgi:hypothetical protein